jgi:hypothetical protein
LHPEQDAQQSAEGQHDTFAAFTTPARLSAITAVNTIALMFFMDFSPFEKSNWFLWTDGKPSAKPRQSSCGDF